MASVFASLYRFLTDRYARNNLKGMTQIIGYLTFNGNCREAMQFYADCLGGELTFQTIGDSPMTENMPWQMKECILQASLTRGILRLLATDCVPDKGLVKGNSISLALNCSDEQEIRTFYDRLSAGGQPTHPLENTFWGTMFGGLTDKFGIHWLLNYDKNHKQ